MKQPTSPAPTCSRGRASGFTFLEVLVALVVLVTLTSVVCSALIASLRAEETARRVQEARQVLGSVYARELSGRPVTGPAGWEIRSATVRNVGVTGAEWRVYTIYPADRPSLHVVTAHRVK